MIPRNNSRSLTDHRQRDTALIPAHGQKDQNIDKKLSPKMYIKNTEFLRVLPVFLGSLGLGDRDGLGGVAPGSHTLAVHSVPDDEGPRLANAC